MKTKVDIDDFLNLILWVKTYSIINQKKFKYDNLVDQAETYKLKNIPLDINIHRIDDLMIEAFKVYFDLKEKTNSVKEFLNTYQIFNKDLMLYEIDRYQKIFEDLLENYKYEDPEICGIQKGFLSEKMKEYVIIEDYENAAKIRDIINEI